jgi:hypothetical protein
MSHVGLFVAGGVALAVVVGVALLVRSLRAPSLPASGEPESTTPTAPPAEGLMALRERLLRSSPAQYRLTPRSGVWGVVMDFGMNSGFGTILALVDGAASLYLSAGGGILGGVNDPAVRKAAVRAVDLAAGVAASMSPCEDPTPPERGRIRISVLTEAGVVSTVVDEDTLVAEVSAATSPKSLSALAYLFLAMRAVLDRLNEMVERKRSPAPTTSRH